jgi:hypothetical protein
MVFILIKVKLGVGLYFLGAVQVWDIWDMAEKNTQSFRPKFRFSPIAPECTSTRLRITQNLVEDSFLDILNNFEVKRTLFGEGGKIIPRFTEKIHHRPFESNKNSSNHSIGLKICQLTQIEEGFQNCCET